jgi:presenilin-like A22 family membrane protease
MSKTEKAKTNDLFPIFLMAGLFVLVDLSSLLLVTPFETAGVTAFMNPNDPLNLVYFFASLIVTTVIILLVARFWKRLVEAIVLGATGYMVFFVFVTLLSFVVSGIAASSLSIIAAAAIIILLVKFPEWYVVDASGILMALGAIALLGISLSIFLVILLLIGLAIYDAISVRGTKHMITLADVVLELRLPVMLIIPKIRGYSLLKDKKSLKEKLKEGEEREAFAVGTGDLVMPGILVASTFSNISTNGFLIALSVIFGTLFGFSVLTIFLLRGRPQPGLPYLCSGAILGYIVSSYLLFGGLIGLTIP